MVLQKDDGPAIFATEYKKEIVEKALDGWTKEHFTTKNYTAYDENGKAVAWCALGRLLYISNVIFNDANVSISIDTDFEYKYGYCMAPVNDGWFGYWRVKHMLRRLYD